MNELGRYNIGEALDKKYKKLLNESIQETEPETIINEGKAWDKIQDLMMSLSDEDSKRAYELEKPAPEEASDEELLDYFDTLKGKFSPQELEDLLIDNYDIPEDQAQRLVARYTRKWDEEHDTYAFVNKMNSSYDYPKKASLTERYDIMDSQGHEIVKKFKDLDDGRIHVIVRRMRDYALGHGYRPEYGSWGQGQYGYDSAEEAEEALRTGKNSRYSAYNVKEIPIIESLTEAELAPIKFSKDQLNDPKKLDLMQPAKDEFERRRVEKERLAAEKAKQDAEKVINTYLSKGGSSRDILLNAGKQINLRDVQNSELLEVIRAFNIFADETDYGNYYYDEDTTLRPLSYIYDLGCDGVLECLETTTEEIGDNTSEEESYQDELISNIAEEVMSFINENPVELQELNTKDCTKVSISYRLRDLTPECTYTFELPNNIIHMEDFISDREMASDIEEALRYDFEGNISVSFPWGQEGEIRGLTIRDCNDLDNWSPHDWDKLWNNLADTWKEGIIEEAALTPTEVYEKVKEILNYQVFVVMGLTKEDLYNNGSIYYMNRNDGTDFDWNVNNMTCEFEIFYDNEMGACKVNVYDDGTIRGYYWEDEGRAAGQPTERVEIDANSAWALEDFLEIEADGKDLYDEEADKVFGITTLSSEEEE